MVKLGVCSKVTVDCIGEKDKESIVRILVFLASGDAIFDACSPNSNREDPKKDYSDIGKINLLLLKWPSLSDEFLRQKEIFIEFIRQNEFISSASDFELNKTTRDDYLIKLDYISKILFNHTLNRTE